MSTALAVALIALLGTIASIVLTAFSNIWAEARREQREGKAALDRHRVLLRSGASELSRRLSNVLDGGFLDTDVALSGESDPLLATLADDAVNSTLFRVAQYLGTVEIARRYSMTADARFADEANALFELTLPVAETFATDSYPDGPRLMLWREAQRAVDELMITREQQVLDTIGYGTFVGRFDEFRPWLSRMHALFGKGIRVSEWPELQRAADLRDRCGQLVAALT